MAVRITRAGVGLTVGIIILALVVLGGLYLVRERGEQARRDDAIEIAQENIESDNEEAGTLTPSIDGSAQTEQESASEDTASNAGSRAESAPGELPATGPNDIAALVSIGLLSFAIASYVSSRKANARV